jgi:hypothetical protein
MAAGLGFKTFTTGEVLTAADTNGYLMQGILVFASAAARDAAITSPQEGQYAYLKDTNVTTYYTGSAWASASAASGALTLITTTSFSAAAAMSVNNCFTSTYTNYLIQFKLAVTTGTVDILYKERSSGTDDSDFYYYASTKVTSAGTVTGTGAANTTAFTICNTSTDGYGSIIVYSPNVATNTYYDWKTMDFSPNTVSGGGLHASTPTTCDGFSIIPASSTITGTVSVYGYSK